jgi:predicted transglutaminase-like cysteine proteinase
MAAFMVAAFADAPLPMRQILGEIEVKYGMAARDRVREWLDLIDADKNKSVEKKIARTNEFFNRLKFVDDAAHWGKSDYWATPIEMLATEGGDCEDFSIAKYFTLRALGIPENRLRLVYVKALRLDQAHMVLTYAEAPGAVPLVLDNLDAAILPATRRSDLQPIYSFNAEGLWLAKQRGGSQQVGGAERVGLWRDLLLRMRELQADSPKE